MSVFTTGELHEVADNILALIRTVPRHLKFSDISGGWIPVDKFKKHIKSESMLMDNDTLFVILGMLIGRGDLECHRAHGRGVGYFFIIREAQEATETENE